MKLEKVIVERPYKKVYRCEEGIAKVFEPGHPKEDVFNEALNQARVEATGLDIPKVVSVNEIDGRWALVVEYKEGKTLEELMREHPENMDQYLDEFVNLQLQIHGKTAPLLNQLKDKLVRQINSLKNVVDATTRYELLTRLDSMPTHHKVCHGDFNPSNVIVSDDGKFYVVDWAHATQGNASADAAMTYLMFAVKDKALADNYLKVFCKKSDIARQYVEQWIPIAAASELTKKDAMEKDFLMQWIDIFDYQ